MNQLTIALARFKRLFTGKWAFGMIAFSFCAAMLLPAGSAQAYAIYNHVNHKVCVQTSAAEFFLLCNFTISANGHHNGSHGSGLGSHCAQWKGEGKCWLSENFEIPKGGYARIYPTKVEVYEHNGDHVSTKAVRWMDPGDCPGPINGLGAR